MEPLGSTSGRRGTALILPVSGRLRWDETVNLTAYIVCRYILCVHEPTFLILTALADQPLHGYGVIAAVEELSEGRVRLRAGTLYGALDRLVEDGLVTVDGEEVVNGRLRRYYRLTDDGATALAAEAARLQRNAQAATARLAARGTPRPAFRIALAARALGPAPLTGGVA
jgi:DNA-binding PadR family transcriptional regulator